MTYELTIYLVQRAKPPQPFGAPITLTAVDAEEAKRKARELIRKLKLPRVRALNHTRGGLVAYCQEPPQKLARPGELKVWRRPPGG